MNSYTESTNRIDELPDMSPTAKFFYNIAYVLLTPVREVRSIIDSVIHKEEAIDKLYKHCKELAENGYEEKVLRVLEKTKAKLRANRDSKFNINIPPFGKFNVISDYFKILKLIYDIFANRKNWKKAEEVCDELLEDMCVQDGSDAIGFESWIIKKSTCLQHIAGNESAKSYLSKFVRPDKSDYTINVQLEELNNMS